MLRRNESSLSSLPATLAATHVVNQEVDNTVAFLGHLLNLFRRIRKPAGVQMALDGDKILTRRLGKGILNGMVAGRERAGRGVADTEEPSTGLCGDAGKGGQRSHAGDVLEGAAQIEGWGGGVIAVGVVSGTLTGLALSSGFGFSLLRGLQPGVCFLKLVWSRIEFGFGAVDTVLDVGNRRVVNELCLSGNLLSDGERRCAGLSAVEAGVNLDVASDTHVYCPCRGRHVDPCSRRRGDCSGDWQSVCLGRAVCSRWYAQGERPAGTLPL